MGDSPLPIILLLVVIALIGIALLAIIFLTHGTAKKLDQAQYRAAWLDIENNLDKNNAATYQFAIMSADKLLDRALKELGYKGNTMAERLKSASGEIKNQKAVWAAHRIRNKIVHEVDTRIDLKLSKQMLDIYKTALKAVGAI